MDSGVIYVINNGGDLIELRTQSYDSEDILQGLLEKYPNLLAGEQIDTVEPRRWLLISREVGLPSQENSGTRWSVDHLFVDQDGIPTLVEVKRGDDARIRREVVGQMLDYAANAVLYWPVESLRALFEAQCRTTETDSETSLTSFLGTDTAIEDFWEKVRTNLQAGKIRLIFVSDEIPTELRRIIDFLNVQMNPAEVIGIEVKQYKGKDLKTLVPRVISTAKRRESDLPPISWGDGSFFEMLGSKYGQNDAKIAKSLLDWAQSQGLRIWWGKGRQYGSFYPMLNYKGGEYWLFSVWTYGKIQVEFNNMLSRPPFDSEEKRLELLHRLNTIPGISLPEESINRLPSFLLSVLSKPDNLKEFLHTYHWYIKEIKQYKDNLK